MESAGAKIKHSQNWDLSQSTASKFTISRLDFFPPIARTACPQFATSERIGLLGRFSIRTVNHFLDTVEIAE